MDTIIATLQDATRVSRASSGAINDIVASTPDRKLNEMLRAAMRERAVFAKGILMSSKLGSLISPVETTEDSGDEREGFVPNPQHTPLTERKSALLGETSFMSASSSSVTGAGTKGKENTSEAEELEALMMSEVEL